MDTGLSGNQTPLLVFLMVPSSRQKAAAEGMKIAAECLGAEEPPPAAPVSFATSSVADTSGPARQALVC